MRLLILIMVLIICLNSVNASTNPSSFNWVRASVNVNVTLNATAVNPFNQSLNTTDNVTFNRVDVTSGVILGTPNIFYQDTWVYYASLFGNSYGLLSNITTSRLSWVIASNPLWTLTLTGHPRVIINGSQEVEYNITAGGVICDSNGCIENTGNNILYVCPDCEFKELANVTFDNGNPSKTNQYTIIIGCGDYDGDYTLPNWVSLIGRSKQCVSIGGSSYSIIPENNTMIKDITFNSPLLYSILLSNNAENITIDSIQVNGGAVASLVSQASLTHTNLKVKDSVFDTTNSNGDPIGILSNCYDCEITGNTLYSGSGSSTSPSCIVLGNANGRPKDMVVKDNVCIIKDSSSNANTDVVLLSLEYGSYIIDNNILKANIPDKNIDRVEGIACNNPACNMTLTNNYIDLIGNVTTTGVRVKNQGLLYLGGSNSFSEGVNITISNNGTYNILNQANAYFDNIQLDNTTTGGNAGSDICIDANNKICRCGSCA